MTHTVMTATNDSVELWDGASYSERKHGIKSTMTCYVGANHDFRAGDLVDIVVVLRECPVLK